MQGFEEKIKACEQEIRETPYHKGTQHHIGRLRARIARLKEEIIQKEIKGKRGGGEGFAQKKYGDATVVLVGFPSVGKSTLLNKLTHAQAKVAAYDFTTLEVIPGMMDYQGAKIQIFDIPGIVSGAAKGRGRGREILSVARIADLLLLMVEVTSLPQVEQIKNELHEAGVRLDRQPPEVVIKRRLKGGVKIISSSLDPATVSEIAKEFCLTNAELIFNGQVTLEDFIDTLIGNRVYLPSLVVVNKIDLLPLNESTSLIHSLKGGNKEMVFISAETEEGLGQLKEKIWQKLGLFRIYLKPRGEKPDLENPLILKRGQTVLAAARKIHREEAEDIRSAQVWGKSAKFLGQAVSLTHQLEEGDVVTFLTRVKEP